MPKLNNKYYRFFIFLVGIIATIAYRIIVILNHYSELWVEIAWYIGTIGFIWYFAHRYKIESKRDKLIEELKLSEKISKGKNLDSKDREALTYILSGLQTSLARWNYIAIFGISFVALAYAIYQNISSLL